MITLKWPGYLWTCFAVLGASPWGTEQKIVNQTNGFANEMVQLQVPRRYAGHQYLLSPEQNYFSQRFDTIVCEQEQWHVRVVWVFQCLTKTWCEELLFPNSACQRQLTKQALDLWSTISCGCTLSVTQIGSLVNTLLGWVACNQTIRGIWSGQTLIAKCNDPSACHTHRMFFSAAGSVDSTSACRTKSTTLQLATRVRWLLRTTDSCNHKAFLHKKSEFDISLLLLRWMLTESLCCCFLLFSPKADHYACQALNHDTIKLPGELGDQWIWYT